MKKHYTDINIVNNMKKMSLSPLTSIPIIPTIKPINKRKYYFDEPDELETTKINYILNYIPSINILKTFKTVWYGYIDFSMTTDNYTICREDLLKIDTIVTQISNINWYINISVMSTRPVH